MGLAVWTGVEEEVTGVEVGAGVDVVRAAGVRR